MRFSNRTALRALTVRAWTAIMVTLASFGAISGSVTGCTEVDNRLGSDFLLGNQRMQTRVVYFEGAGDGDVKSLEGKLDTYVYRLDSVYSSRLGIGIFGKTSSANFGVRTNSMVLQFSPSTIPYGDKEGYGFDPVVDSMYIVMELNDARGDTLKEQSFEVWDIVEHPDRGFLSRDEIYYANFPIDEYKGAEKLFDFTHVGLASVSAKLEPTAAGRAFLDRIVTLDWDEYIDDDKFRENFSGLYITPTAASPADAATYSADLSLSGLVLYARNHDEFDTSAIYDTLVTSFMFKDADDAETGTEWNNVSINIADFDYTGTEFGAAVNDTLPTSAVQQKLFVQSMGGVGAYLRFTDEFIADLHALRTNDEGRECDIMINQAMMYVYLESGSTDALESSLPRLGSYLDVVDLLPIPDYQFSNEALQRQKKPTYILPYNGYVNRSNSRYELDITAYVQQLAARKGDPSYRNMQRVMMLGADAFYPFGFGESELRGPADPDKPISIRLTYTLIEKGESR